MNKKSTLPYLRLIIICLSTILTLLLAFVLYNVAFKHNSPYITAMKSYILKINNINQNLFSTKNNEQAIDINSLKSSIPDSINDLNDLKKSSKTLNYPSEYKADYENFFKGVDNNLLILKQTLAILNNINSNDISNSLKNISKYKDNCNKYYKFNKDYGAEINLDNKITNLIGNLSSYVTSIKEIQKSTDIITSQNVDFENQINNLYTKFSQLQTNFSCYKKNSRKSSLTIDYALSEVTKNKNQFIIIKNDFSKLTVPNKALQCYEAFSHLLIDYNAYVDIFINALNTEKYATADKNITLLYSAGEDKYKMVENDLKDFVIIFNTLKY